MDDPYSNYSKSYPMLEIFYIQWINEKPYSVNESIGYVAASSRSNSWKPYSFTFTVEKGDVFYITLASNQRRNTDIND